MTFHQDALASRRMHISEGWIFLPLIAAGALAYDNTEFAITVDNEYIPQWLVRREFDAK
ncbi:MAG: hypothetical protein AAFV88_03960 [Planctomycetota bacterium]